MPYKVHFISLGCAKNVVNCEQMMALCRQAGHILQPEPEGADAVVVNTCGFLSSANEEAIGHILQMGRLKARGQIGRILRIPQGTVKSRLHKARKLLKQELEVIYDET